MPATHPLLGGYGAQLWSNTFAPDGVATMSRLTVIGLLYPQAICLYSATRRDGSCSVCRLPAGPGRFCDGHLPCHGPANDDGSAQEEVDSLVRECCRLGAAPLRCTPGTRHIATSGWLTDSHKHERGARLYPLATYAAPFSGCSAPRSQRSAAWRQRCCAESPGVAVAPSAAVVFVAACTRPDNLRLGTPMQATSSTATLSQDAVRIAWSSSDTARD